MLLILLADLPIIAFLQFDANGHAINIPSGIILLEFCICVFKYLTSETHIHMNIKHANPLLRRVSSNGKNVYFTISHSTYCMLRKRHAVETKCTREKTKTSSWKTCSANILERYVLFSNVYLVSW